MVKVSGTVGGVVTDPIDIFASSQFTLSLGTSGAQTGELNEGVYDICCTTADMYIKVAQTANDVTTSNGYLVFQGNMLTVAVPQGSKIGGVVASGTATMILHKVG